MELNYDAKLFMDAAIAAQKNAILQSVVSRSECSEVPCVDGLNHFNKMVRAYWRMCDIAGIKGDAAVVHTVCEQVDENQF